MYLESLRLINFRNYVRLDSQFAPGIIILHGDNAQGKTSFLEAVYYLSTATASHARHDRQLVHFDAADDLLSYAQLDATVHRNDGPQRATLTLAVQNNRSQKRIEWNGVAQRIYDYVGQINVVLFLPEDIDLIASGPNLRRRYLDSTISQIDSSYYRVLGEYDEVLTQRNAHLRALSEQGVRPKEAEALLEIWDDRLVEPGAFLTLRRQQVLARLDELANTIHGRLTNYREHLRLAYLPRIDLGHHASHQLSLDMGSGLLREGGILTLGEVMQRFRATLKRRRRDELARGMTLVGPHRDDVRFLVDGVDMTDYGSRGQQRTAALTLKLSEVAYIEEKRGDSPILLLDDVMSELDDHRRRDMATLLAQYEQVFLTTADLNNITPVLQAAARLIHVEQGNHREA